MEQLLDIRDGMSVAKHLITGVILAAQSPNIAGSDRAALCAVANAAREHLEGTEAAIDLLIANPVPP